MSTLPTLEQLAEVAVQWLQARGLANVELDLEQREIVVHDGTGTKKLFLGNLYRRYRDASPSMRPEILDGHLQGMLEVDNLMKQDDYAQARVNLMPVVRDLYTADLPLRAAVSEKADIGADARLAMRLFTADILMGLALDQPNTLALVTEAQLTKWGVSFEDAMQHALHNLREKSKVEAWAQDGPGIWRAAWRDGYASSRLLLPELFKNLPFKDPVAIAPVAHSLYVTSASNVQAMKLMALIAAKSAERESRWISFQLLRLQDGRWAPAEVPARVREPLAELTAKHLAAAYDNQAAVLNARFEREKIECFAPSVQLLRQGDGPLMSMCVWNTGQACMLPKTDMVAVCVQEGRSIATAMLPWAQMMEAFGSFLAPTQDSPVRYRTTSSVPAELVRKHPQTRVLPIPSLADLS